MNDDFGPASLPLEPPAVPRADGSMSKAFYEIRFVRQLYRQQT